MIFIQCANDKLTGKIDHQERTLLAINETQYFADGLKAPLSFIKAGDGSVTGIRMQDLGQEIYRKVKL